MQNNKDLILQVRFSEADKLLLEQAIADTWTLTGQLMTRSDIVRLALNEYYQKLEDLKEF